MTPSGTALPLMLLVVVARFAFPPEPEIIIDATPAARAAQVYRGPPIPLTVCIRVLPTQRHPESVEET